MAKRVPLKFQTTPEQVAACKRAARERGISKNAFLRGLVEAATGAPDTIDAKYSRGATHNFDGFNARRAAAIGEREASK